MDSVRLAAVERRANRHAEERKQAEEMLRQSEQRYRLLADHMADVLWKLDFDARRFIYISPSVQRLRGYTVEEAMAQTMEQMLTEESMAAVHRMIEVRLKAFLAGDPAALTQVHEVELTRKHDSPVWTEMVTTVLRNEHGGINVVGVSRDISERKRAQEALRESEIELAANYDSSPLMMCLVNRERQVERMNRAMAELAGTVRPHGSGQRPGDILGCVHALDNPQGCGSGTHCPACPLRAAIDNAFDAGQPCRKLEAGLLLERDGVRREIQLSASISLLRPQDQPKILVCLEDITDHKQLEEQFLQAQKMETIGQLAGGVAHDFNNILAATLMHLGMLQQDPELSTSVKASLMEVEKEVMRATNLTRQLLLFSRRQAAKAEALNMNGLINDLLKMLRRLLGEDIEVIFQSSTDSVWISADKGMMEQVVMNLCINSRDAMPKGGTLTLGASLAEIQSQSAKLHQDARSGCFVCLLVTDTGCGMDKAVLGRLFEPFFTTKGVGKGTGLGLATVYGIIKQHEGWVEVESSVGSGSSFRVYTPARAKPAGVAAMPIPAGKIKGGSETILLVEDEFSVRQVTALCLRKLGYAVFEAGNGLEALRVWKEHHDKIELLFTDMVMPEGMTGLDLAHQLKKDNGSLKVIISSGYNERVATAQPAGQEATYLAKPLRAAALAKTVRHCLDEIGEAQKHDALLESLT
jgi:PAS domain S-box-containing protein